MSVDYSKLKCLTCGESNEKYLIANKKMDDCFICDRCGSVFFVTNNSEQSALKEAQNALSLYNFSKADDLYKNILMNTSNEKTKAMCYFGRLMSLFGVVYIKDFNGNLIVTFCNYDPQYTSIKETSYFECLMNNEHYLLYQDKLEILDKEYKKIKYELNKGLMYDVFICTKISLKTKDNPNCEGFTEDSRYALKLYDELTSRGLSVFYSDKLLSGIDYDAQIYSALLRSKNILVISTKKDYLESPWVESEWRRWINFIEKDIKEKSSMLLYVPLGQHIDLPRRLEKIQKFNDPLDIVTLLVSKSNIIKLISKKEEKGNNEFDQQYNLILFDIAIGEYDKAEKQLKDLCIKFPKDHRPWFSLLDICIEKNVDFSSKLFKLYYNRAKELCDDETKKKDFLIYEEIVNKKLTKPSNTIITKSEKPKISENIRCPICFSKGDYQIIDKKNNLVKCKVCDSTFNIKDNKQINCLLCGSTVDLVSGKNFDNSVECKTCGATTLIDYNKVLKCESCDNIDSSKFTKIDENSYRCNLCYFTNNIDHNKKNNFLEEQKNVNQAIDFFNDKKYNEAYNFFIKYAENNKIAQFYLGQMYEDGYYVKKDSNIAVDYYKKSAANGYCNAQNVLGLLYEKGKLVDKDLKKAYLLYKEAAEQDYGPAQNNLGLMYAKGIYISVDYEKAYKYFKDAERNKCPEVYNNLGVMFQDGFYVKKDIVKAIEYYEKGDKCGDVAAQYNLGLIYFNGEEVSKDYATARIYFEKCAEKNHVDALTNLGYIYYNGYAGSGKIKKAYEYLKKAADLGSADAKYNLALIYYDGIIVDENPSIVIKYLNEAASQGNIDAKIKLAECYRDGYGVTQNLINSYNFYVLAYNAGRKEVKECMDNIYKQLSKSKKQDQQKKKGFFNFFDKK